MSVRALKSKLSTLCILVFFACPPGLSRNSASANEPPKALPCIALEYRQFDFWVGDWDAFELGTATPAARVQVDPLLDGCVLREKYAGADGHEGESLSMYDISRKVWHQSWVTNRGELLVIEGTFQAEGMVLTGASHTVDGQEKWVRGIWKPESGGVRETAATSTDGGKSWKPWFDLVFRRHH